MLKFVQKGKQLSPVVQSSVCTYPPKHPSRCTYVSLPLGSISDPCLRVVPSMGPIVSVVIYMIIKTHSRIPNQSGKPGNATVNGYCMSVAVCWANKME